MHTALTILFPAIHCQFGSPLTKISPDLSSFLSSRYNQTTRKRTPSGPGLCVRVLEMPAYEKLFNTKCCRHFLNFFSSRQSIFNFLSVICSSYGHHSDVLNFSRSTYSDKNCLERTRMETDRLEEVMMSFSIFLGVCILLIRSIAFQNRKYISRQ